MKPTSLVFSWLLAPLALLLLTASGANAAANGIRDDAKFFSPDAVSKAEQVIHQIDQKHQRDVLIETLPSVPADQKQQLDQLGKDTFFKRWADSRAASQGVSGIYILITREPSHLEVAVGNRTQQRLFTRSDRDAVRDQLLTAFREKQFDQGLLQAVRTIQQRMDANVPVSSSGSGSNSGTVVPGGGGGGGGLPRGNPSPFPAPAQRSWGIGGLACLIIGAILIIMLVRGIFGRSGGGGYYGGAPGGGYQQGGYPQGGYPPQGGYGYGGGGGGGGFGRGLLGGLLGGAIGGYAADKWMHHGEQGQSGGGYVPPASGGGAESAPGPDTSFDSSGGDFGGGGGGGGSDFGGGGGGDFGGGGGGDFGGGGGGDSGGGGGDF